jgi:two-component system sensor histidine kinase SenX3
MGIAAEEQRKIFERFYRTRTVRNTNIRGSGIGLALVKHISEAHGGRVTVDSVPGRGTTFLVTVPVRSLPAEPSDGEGSDSDTPQGLDSGEPRAQNPA